MNIVILIGLAVDYTIHMIDGYSRCPQSTRTERVHYMLEEVGVSVLSGATTTLGASLFLLFAIIYFFLKFGAFVFATIGFAMYHSLFTLPAMLAIVGPNGDDGSLSSLFRFFLNSEKKANYSVNKTKTDCVVK